GAGAGLGLLALRLRPPRRELLRLRLARLMARPRTALLPGTALVLALAATPLQPSVRFEDSQAVAVVTVPAIEPSPELAEPAPIEAVPMPEAAQPPRQRVAESPSVVAIAARPDGNFEYRVNGRAEFIRGVGYNPVTKTASPEQRAARFDRDFAAMSAIGVNTVSGWDEGEFDELLLDKAAEYGLGVILPFELRPAWAYDDPKVRQQVRDEVLKRAQRFKDRPALRMWGLGNEVVHGILPRNGPRAQAFSQFLIQAADELHNLDANHPIVYRDAEDVFLEPVARALRANPQPRPWFVYGMNFFTTRMDDALTKGPARSLRQPLLISEFAPAGLRAADRPTGYSKLWGVIQAHRSMLLGGCAYVWSTAGPEPLDRSFGLTNEAGEPVDSTVAALASLFTASASP
ncbi:MAG TPA: hypothetical protein VK457_15255, partial [Chloroflexota bacterium]|nr:hypothetical protein [Chloroflexota bacterium]